MGYDEIYEAVAILTRFLSICPRVSKAEGALVASTAWRLRILTLGWLYRKVTVEPGKKEVTICRRYFWIFARRRRVGFEEVKAVTYGYRDWSFGVLGFTSHHSADVFSVGLRLHGGGDRHLFYFFGDGTITGLGSWPNWHHWEGNVSDLSGTQESESRAFVEQVSKMIRVPVVPGRG